MAEHTTRTPPTDEQKRRNAERRKERAAERRDRAARRIVVRKRPCDECGALFETGPRPARYCKDRACRNRRSTRSAKPESRQRAAAKARGKTIDQVRPVPPEFDCAWCGSHHITGVTTTRRSSRFCPGGKCKSLWHQHLMTEGEYITQRRNRRWAAAQAKLARPLPPARTFVSGRCTRCGEPVVLPPHGTAWDPTRCSAHRKGKKKSTHRKQREAGFTITPGRRLKIYERDDWTCYLCGDPVDRDADPLGDWAPSIDHIIPLAQGGAHAMHNLRCAHRWCNSVKGHRRDHDLTAA